MLTAKLNWRRRISISLWCRLRRWFLLFALICVVSANGVCSARRNRDIIIFGPPNTFRAQTPQSFRFATIRHAYDLAAADPDFHPTDDTRVVVDYLPDEPVAIVSGAETNLKITTLEDIPTAERIAEEILGRDPKEEARARMHALLAQAAGQMHR